MEYEVLSFSKEANFNKDLFYNELNQYNFYFEDKDKEYLYEKLMERLFNFNISSIFCLDGKENVKKKYKDLLKNPIQLNKSVFIVDDDFDILLNKDVYKSKNFIYIGKYNIEALLINKNNVIKTFAGYCAMAQKKIKEIFDYDKWYNELIEDMRKYIILYAAEIKKKIGKKIFCYSLITQNGKIDNDQYKVLLNVFKEKCPEYQKELNIIEKKIKKNHNNDVSNFICGKFIIRSLTNYFQKYKRNNMNDNVINCTLIDNVDEKDLLKFKNDIIAAI